MTTILAFIFVLGVLVFVHELGHFLVARWYGVRVHTFSIGFGPKLLKFTRGDTEYAISAIPLGGYVKLAGETVEDQRSGAPDEFLSKSKWVRFQVYLAGPVMNLGLAVIVLAISLMGGADVPASASAPPVVGSVAEDSPAARAGLQPGDRVLRVNNREVRTWDAFDIEVLPAANREVVLTVQRGAEELQIPVTPEAVGHYEIGHLGLLPVQRPQIVQVSPDSPAQAAGFQYGDVIVAVNGERDLSQPEIIERIRASEGQVVRFTLERGEQAVDLSVEPALVGGVPQVGVIISPVETRRIEPGIIEAFQLSAKQNWEWTVLIGRTLKGLFSRETPVRQLIGPIGMAELSGSAAEIGWQALLSLMAMISLNLGLLNLMPVPVLDGGHIAILAVEGLARRDLSAQIKEKMLLAGAALIVLLMVTVIYNDIARYFR